jgi:hypothetical protein
VSAAVSLLAVAGCAAKNSPAAPRAVEDGPVRVLFIGNSLTAGNDLPQLVQAMAVAGGVPMEIDSATTGGFSLEDHWSGGDARKKLAKSRWTLVVLQQGPSSLPDSQKNLREWACTWAAEVRQRGATPALYMGGGGAPARRDAGPIHGLALRRTGERLRTGVQVVPSRGESG